MALILCSIAGVLVLCVNCFLWGCYVTKRRFRKGRKAVLRVGQGCTMPGLEEGDSVVVYAAGEGPYPFFGTAKD